MRSRFKHRLFSSLAASLALFGLSQSVRASLVNFDGTQQTLNATLTGSGSSNIVGASPIFLQLLGGNYDLNPNPQSTSLSLIPNPIALDTHPLSIGLPKVSKAFDVNKTDFEAVGGHLIGAFDTDLDLLNGQTTTKFGISTITLNVDQLVKIGDIIFPVPGTLTIDLGGVLDELTFEQTGGATFTDGAINTGTYGIPGQIHGHIHADIKLNGGSVTSTDFDLDQKLTVTGSYLLDGTIPKSIPFSLDGGVNLSLPVSVHSAINTNLGIAGLTGTIDIGATINFALGYHLQGVLVPEPGSIILFSIGLLAMVPLVRRGLVRRK